MSEKQRSFFIETYKFYDLKNCNSFNEIVIQFKLRNRHALVIIIIKILINSGQINIFSSRAHFGILW